MEHQHIIFPLIFVWNLYQESLADGAYQRVVKNHAQIHYLIICAFWERRCVIRENGLQNMDGCNEILLRPASNTQEVT